MPRRTRDQRLRQQRRINLTDENMEGFDSKPHHQRNLLIDGGCLAIGLLIFQAFLSSTTLDLPMFVALGALTVALPTTVLDLLVVRRHLEYGYMVQCRWFFVLNGWTSFGGWFATFVGIDAAFWHLSWILGGLFLLASLVGYIFLDRYFAFHDLWKDVDWHKEPPPRTMEAPE